jgi:hypothetical protein
MRVLGFSTGAIALSDFRAALATLAEYPIQAVELSAIRESELAPLLAALHDLDLGRFEYVSIHAPSAFSPAMEACIFEHLYATRNRQWPIVVHPDTLHDFSLWKCLGHLLCIENMDQRKPIGRTARELDRIFDQLPDASFCLDVGHARQVDSSMVECYLMLKNFGRRLRQVHISEVNTRSKHDPLSFVTMLNFQEIAYLIPLATPVIIESIVKPDQIPDEIRRVRTALETRATMSLKEQP